MRRIPVGLGVAGLIALGLAVSGCGGGSKSSSATTAPATTAAAATTTTTTAAATPATTTEAATTTASTATQANLSAFAHGKCRSLAALGQKFSRAFTGAANAGDVKKEADLLQSFTKQVPSDIRPDFQVVADYLTKIAGVVGKVKPGQTPDAQTLAKLQQLSKSVDTTKLTQAEQHIEAWVQKNCKA